MPVIEIGGAADKTFDDGCVGWLLHRLPEYVQVTDEQWHDLFAVLAQCCLYNRLPLFALCLVHVDCLSRITLDEPVRVAIGKLAPAAAAAKGKQQAIDEPS
jgi:hypothetical protein